MLCLLLVADRSLVFSFVKTAIFTQQYNRRGSRSIWTSEGITQTAVRAIHLFRTPSDIPLRHLMYYETRQGTPRLWMDTQAGHACRI